MALLRKQLANGVALLNQRDWSVLPIGNCGVRIDAEDMIDAGQQVAW